MQNWNPIEGLKRLWANLFTEGAIPRTFGAIFKKQPDRFDELNSRPLEQRLNEKAWMPETPEIDFSTVLDSIDDLRQDNDQPLSFQEMAPASPDLNTETPALEEPPLTWPFAPLGSGFPGATKPRGSSSKSPEPNLTFLAPSDDDMLLAMGINPDDQIVKPEDVEIDLQLPAFEAPEFDFTAPDAPELDVAIPPIDATSITIDTPELDISVPDVPDFNGAQQAFLDSIARDQSRDDQEQPVPEFANIEPPANLFESTVEAFAKFAAWLSGVTVKDGQTATETLAERAFGKPKTADGASRTISETISPIGPRGLLNRRMDGNGFMAKAGRRIAKSRVGQAATSASSAFSVSSLAAVALVGFIGAVAFAAGSLRSLATMGIAAADRVAKFSGQILAAKTSLEVGRTFRDIQKANELGPNAAEYYKQLNRFEAMIEPLVTNLEKFGLWVASTAVGFGPDFVKSPFATLVDYNMPDAIFGKPGEGVIQDTLVEFARSIDDTLHKALVALNILAEKDPDIAGEIHQDPLALHNIMINGAFRGQRPPVKGLGAAPVLGADGQWHGKKKI